MSQIQRHTQATSLIKDQYQRSWTESTTRKEKETKEKEKDTEEEKVAEDRKEKEEVLEEVMEEVTEKAKEERKVERVCGRLKVKATKVEKEKVDKELYVTIAVRPATLPLSVGRHQVEKERRKVEKERCEMFRKLEKRIGTQMHKQVHQRNHKQEQHQQQKEMNRFEGWLQRQCLSLKRLRKMMIM